MAKPPDNNATMEVTESQLLALDKPAKRPIPPPASTNKPSSAGGDKNDASAWAYRVVGSDDFAPTPAKPAAPRVRASIIVLLVLVVLGAGGYYAYTHWFATEPAPAAPAVTPAPAAPAPTPPAPKPTKPPAKKK